MKFTNINIIIILLMFLSRPACSAANFADLSADSRAFCSYFTEKSEAKIVNLISPDVIARFDNNHYDNNLQKNLIIGLSKDLIDVNKANYVRRLIDEECLYDKLNQAGQLQIQYFMSSIKYESLKFKLQEIHLAKSKIEKILSFIKKRIHHQYDTLQTYYQIESSLKKLDEDEQEINLNLAGQLIPTIPYTNLVLLLKNLSMAREKRQKTLNELEKQNNWSIRLEGGAQRDFANQSNQKINPYIALMIRYNLGSPFSNNLLDRSLKAHAMWQSHQVTGTENKLLALIHSITLFKVAAEKRLLQLKQNDQSDAKLYNKLTSSNSIQAMHFRQEIAVNRIMHKIKINEARHTIQLLQAVC